MPWTSPHWPLQNPLGRSRTWPITKHWVLQVGWQDSCRDQDGFHYEIYLEVVRWCLKSHRNSWCTWWASSGPIPSPGIRVTVCLPPYRAGGGCKKMFLHGQLSLCATQQCTQSVDKNGNLELLFVHCLDITGSHTHYGLQWWRTGGFETEGRKQGCSWNKRREVNVTHTHHWDKPVQWIRKDKWKIKHWDCEPCRTFQSKERSSGQHRWWVCLWENFHETPQKAEPLSSFIHSCFLHNSQCKSTSVSGCTVLQQSAVKTDKL